MRTRIVVTVILFQCLLSAGAAAQTVAETARVAGQAAIDAAFSDLERRTIEGFYGKSERWTAADNEPTRGEVEAPASDSTGKGQGKGGKSKSKHKGKGKGKQKGLPPGLAKREQLPPGLARKLEQDGTLPPGLAKRSLPADLESRLPPPPRGTERVIVDRDVVLVDLVTGVVLDAISVALD